jgi:hypothetical protein
MTEPKGKIKEFADDPILYQAIGKFVYQFSQLEFAIRHLLSDLLELTPDQFYIVTASYDFARLCRVTSAFIHTLLMPDEPIANEVTEIFSRCFRINDARVRLVHGIWDDDGARHVSLTSLKPTTYFSDVKEIGDFTQETKACLNLIVKLIDGEIVDWARNIRSHYRDE